MCHLLLVMLLLPRQDCSPLLQYQTAARQGQPCLQTSDTSDVPCCSAPVRHKTAGSTVIQSDITLLGYVVSKCGQNLVPVMPELTAFKEARREKCPMLKEHNVLSKGGWGSAQAPPVTMKAPVFAEARGSILPSERKSPYSL